MISNVKNKKKSNTGQTFLLFGGIVIVSIILMGLLVANIKMYQKKKEFLAQVENLKTQIKDIETKNNNLKQGIESSDDSEYMEKVAREELDLQKPGEKAVSFIVPPTPTEQTVNQKKTGWQAWIGNIVDWIKK